MKAYYVGILIIALSLGMDASAFNYSAYAKSTVSMILEKHKNDACGSKSRNDYFLSYGFLKYSVIGKYTGIARPIDPEVKMLIEAWDTGLKKEGKMAALYKNELLFHINGNEFWMPSQQQLLPHMVNEMKAGDTFKVYVVLIGSINNKCVLLLSEFKSNPKDS